MSKAPCVGFHKHSNVTLTKKTYPINEINKSTARSRGPWIDRTSSKQCSHFTQWCGWMYVKRTCTKKHFMSYNTQGPPVHRKPIAITFICCTIKYLWGYNMEQKQGRLDTVLQYTELSKTAAALFNLVGIKRC